MLPSSFSKETAKIYIQERPRATIEKKDTLVEIRFLVHDMSLISEQRM